MLGTTSAESYERIVSLQIGLNESVNSIIYEDEDKKEARLEKCRPQPAGHSRPSEGLPPVIEHLMKMMPTNCTTLGLRAYGTVGSTWDLSQTVELKNKASFSLLMLPKIPGVHINPFVIQREAFMTVKKMKPGLLSDEQLEGLTGISPTEEVRCLIVFCDSPDGEGAAELLIQTLLKRMNNKMAVGGGIGDQFFTSASHTAPLLTGLAISGDSVQALSAVIPQNVTKANKIQEILEQLKSCDLPSENCVGFMFSCMGRCVGRPKGVKGTESTLFRNYFPTVPLIGFFGCGEIGFNFVLPCKNQEKSGSVSVSRSEEPIFKKHKSNKTELMHQYSTIFVLVSLRKGKIKH
ncbi:F-box only protein 22-like isoform X2 [Hetaerina americana]|uniref:F-box only protein 22-like isoform X2 n=1 Tax=Hetaerina americana TaxID=62018 RepID=UPI003A7F1992